MNYALIFNHLLKSICINPLDHLELRLNLLSSLSHREDKPPLYKKSLVKADIDVSRVKSNHIQPAVSLTILLMAPLKTFFYRASFVLQPPDKKGINLSIVFFYKLAIKQVAWPWLYKTYRTSFLEKTSANV